MTHVSISPFFLELRSAYQAELDDLTFDSEGKGVLRQRLVAKRKELGFLIQMMEISPEMVAVVFHQGITVREPRRIQQLLGCDADELLPWDAVQGAIELAPWAQELADTVLAEPAGPWFMSLCVALEYMFHKVDASQHSQSDDTDDGDEDDRDNDHDGDDNRNPLDADDLADSDGRSREEAGSDWLAEHGFDRKD